MSSPWNRLRAVDIADLPDADYESTQAALAASVQVGYQRERVENTGDNLSEIEVVVLAYDGAVADGIPTGNIVDGVCDIQVIEVAPYPDENQPARTLVVGKPPVANHPTGRGHEFNVRYNHSFTVLLTNTAAIAGLGALSLEVLWRTYR